MTYFDSSICTVEFNDDFNIKHQEVKNVVDNNDDYSKSFKELVPQIPQKVIDELAGQIKQQVISELNKTVVNNEPEKKKPGPKKMKPTVYNLYIKHCIKKITQMPNYDSHDYRLKFKECSNEWTNGMKEYIITHVAKLNNNPDYAQMSDSKLKDIAKCNYKAFMIKKYQLLDIVPTDEYKQEIIETYNIQV